VYTPDVLAEWAADLLCERLGKRRGVILDPACGDGALLAAASSRRIARLVGVDCDRDALRRANQRVRGGRFVFADGLRFLADIAEGRLKIDIDGVIANPPWGADIEIERAELTSLGYRLTAGQVDSWDLFVEGLLRAARPNAVLVLILPDAVFLPEHKATRALILASSKIEFIARLGEGFFPGVYRGTVVMALRKGQALDQRVTCLRVPPERRRALLARTERFADVARDLSHSVSQTRFLDDPEVRFDIDAKETEHSRLEAYECSSFPWDRWLESGRGIELSKTGRIIRCTKCNQARPLPRKGDEARCIACGHAWTIHRSEATSIVVPIDQAIGAGWHSLIVGEDVDRHVCEPSRAIRIDVPGIRYKPFTMFAQPKLLVRKTGLGVKAALDGSGAATNQVVFHFIARPGAPPGVLDYLEGVLCSRVLLAWHLKRHGETEWRSHPYVTQRVIRQFPIPVPRSEREAAQIAAIVDAVRARRVVRGGHASAEDIEIERLVAGLFGLADDDMKWVLSVLDAAQALEPIRTLRLPSVEMVRPRRVESRTPALHHWQEARS
jgi:predicted RNA methylase